MVPGRHLEPAAFLGNFVAGAAGLAGAAGEGPLASDRRPSLEYAAEGNMIESSRAWFHALVARVLESPSALVAGAPESEGGILDRRAVAVRELRAFLGEGRLGSARDAAGYARFLADLRALQDLCARNQDFAELRAAAAATVYERGNSAYRSKLTALAEELFLHGLRIWPEHAPALGNLVTLYQGKGDYLRAEEMLARHGRVYEGALGLLLRGELAMAQGRIGEAIEAYQTALDRDPDLVHAHGNLGICLYQVGRRDEAVRCFREVARLDPWNVSARANLRKLAAN
jgi:Tfp pilus assembly protein PilF